MELESWILVATAALSAAALGLTAWESRQRRKVLRVEFGLDSISRYLSFQDRFYDLLGEPDDAVQPPEWRKFLIHFFNYYAQLFVAHRLAVFPREHWEGLRTSLAYWARRPEIRQAWQEFRRQPDAWPVGFVEFVDDEIERVSSSAEKLWPARATQEAAWARLRRDFGAEGAPPPH